MSILGDLFDPIGAVATGGNNSDFNSLFSPADNLFGSNGLGFEPSWQTDFTSSYSEPIDEFARNVRDVNVDELRNLGDHAKSSPWQLVYGAGDPLSTKVWNGALGTHNTPFVNMYGGETNADYQNSANRGINTQDGQMVGALANAIAGYYGGQALGGLAGRLYGSATAGAGAEGSMGSSALDVQAELANPAAAGSGGSAAGYDAAQIPGWTAGAGAGGAAGGNAASGFARGAAAGGANALDNGNQNPWTAAFKGGIAGGIGSGMDYAGMAGIDNQYAKGALNGAINGGVRSGMQDESQTGYGALVGALGGLANKVGSYFSAPTSGDNGSSGTTNWGNLATGLGNLYMARQNANGIQSQINGLKDLYSPNSAYAQQMAQQLQRQDAASGRGSQYGTRAVELQARLAQLASQQAPTLSNLYAQQRMNRFNQFAGILGMARNSGLFGGGGNQPQTVNDTSYSPVTAGLSNMYQMPAGAVNQNVMDTLPGNISMGDNPDYYNRNNSNAVYGG